MQDPCYQVRDEFLRKYISFATHQQLPAHFNVIPFLTVHDPEADIRNMVRGHPLPFMQWLINYLQAKAYVSLAYRASPPGFFFEHLTVECADHCAPPRCQDELLRDDLRPVPSSARTSPRFLSLSGKPARYGEVRLPLTVFNAVFLCGLWH